jgi:hypothetical protein
LKTVGGLSKIGRKSKNEEPVIIKTDSGDEALVKTIDK